MVGRMSLENGKDVPFVFRAGHFRVGARWRRCMNQLERTRSFKFTLNLLHTSGTILYPHNFVLFPFQPCLLTTRFRIGLILSLPTGSWRTELTSKFETRLGHSSGTFRMAGIETFHHWLIWEVLSGWFLPLVVDFQLSLLLPSPVSDDVFCCPNQRLPRHSNSVMVQFIALPGMNQSASIFAAEAPQLASWNQFPNRS